MSGLLGIGGGLGIVLSGVILDNLSYHWLFWIPLVVVSIATVADDLLRARVVDPGEERRELARRGPALRVAGRPARSASASRTPGARTSPKTLGLMGGRGRARGRLGAGRDALAAPARRHGRHATEAGLDDESRGAPARLRHVQRVRSHPAVRAGAGVDRLRLRRNGHPGRPLPRALDDRDAVLRPDRRPALEHRRLEGAARAGLGGDDALVRRARRRQLAGGDPSPRCCSASASASRSRRSRT